MIFEIVLLFQKFSSFYFIMDKTTKKENRGGAREGAGRKGLGNTKRVSICLTDELVPVFKQLGGAKWLRCELERVAEPARTLDTDQILVPESSNPIYKPILPKDYDEWRFIGVVKYTIKSN